MVRQDIKRRPIASNVHEINKTYIKYGRGKGYYRLVEDGVGNENKKLQFFGLRVLKF